MLLYLRSASHLRAHQLAYFAIRRLLPARAPAAPMILPTVRPGFSLAPGIACAGKIVAPGRFRFLNVESVFSIEEVDWHASAMPKLWRYNLHYFDFLHDPACTPETGGRLIADWLEHNPVGSEDAWEPYTLSLRVVNWIKSLARPESRSMFTDAAVRSLFYQVLWLEQNVEYHILANHYLKNGKALFFCGACFDGPAAKRWLALGRRILLEEAREQLLQDGGHYERSPMYHAIVIEDYLDVLNLAQNTVGLLSAIVFDALKERCMAALRFLDQMCFADGSWPLFNDAAFDIAPTPAALRAYAQRVIGYAWTPPETGVSMSALHESGYFVMRDGRDMLVVDCGPVGASYQPGHAHCDILSFELALDGERVIVDSGVHDYEASALRAYARSTRAHNTVVVDGAEQSEIWSVFRMARRARPLYAELRRVEETHIEFAGAHDGYRRLAGKVEHHRKILFSRDAGWTIQDELRGGGVHTMESLVHLHPDFEAFAQSDGYLIRRRNGACVAVISLLTAADRGPESGWYFPEFGVRLESAMLVFRCSGALPLKLSYRVEKFVAPQTSQVT